MDRAVTEYFKRERSENANPRGADHKAILADVAQEFGLNPSDLRAAIIDEIVKLGG